MRHQFRKMIKRRWDNKLGEFVLVKGNNYDYHCVTREDYYKYIEDRLIPPEQKTYLSGSVSHMFNSGFIYVPYIPLSGSIK